MELVEYLDNSPNAAWAAETGATLLRSHGFSQATSVGDATGRAFFVRPHAGMLIAVRMPDSTPPKGFRIIGAHTDSPHLRLKPNSAIVTEGNTLLQSEVYGGALVYSWFDRELGLAGEVFFRDNGKIMSRLVRSNGPVAIVPSLAIHLQRGVNDDGFAPNKHTALNALLTHRAADFDFPAFVAELAGCEKENLLSYDLSLFDNLGARMGGALGDLLFSARLDNLVSCHSALTALARGKSSAHAQVVILYDHEEIGSLSESGAESQITDQVLRAVARKAETSEDAYQRLVSESLFLSADMAHGVHPNFSDRHDGANRPRLGQGVVLKMNHNRRYATSAATQAFFVDLCSRIHTEFQVYTHRNDLPCGSTIGPTLSARLGIQTLDVGVAMLGMHSARETCAWADTEAYTRLMKAFLHDHGD